MGSADDRQSDALERRQGWGALQLVGKYDVLNMSERIV